jgi:hypothetical protein
MGQNATKSGDVIAVEVIDTVKGLEQIRPAFRAVYRADPDAGVFLSWEWLHQIFEDHPGQWRLYAVRDDRAPSGYSGFLPVHCFMRWSSSRKRFQTMFTDVGRLGLSDYVGFVCQPEFEDEVLDRLGRYLALHPWARLSLRYEPTQRRSQRFSESFQSDEFSIEWPKHRSEDGRSDMLPVAVVDLPPKYEPFYSGLSIKTRKTLNRAVQTLSEMDGMRYKVTSARTYEEDREALLDLWLIQWEDLGSSERRMAELMEAHRALLDRAHAAGLLFQVSLWHEDRVLCSTAHIVDRKSRSVHVLMEGRDVDNDNLNTGLLLNVFAVQKAIEAGCTGFLFGHGSLLEASML